MTVHVGRCLLHTRRSPSRTGARSLRPGHPPSAIDQQSFQLLGREKRVCRINHRSCSWPNVATLLDAVTCPLDISSLHSTLSCRNENHYWGKPRASVVNKCFHRCVFFLSARYDGFSCQSVPPRCSLYDILSTAKMIASSRDSIQRA